MRTDWGFAALARAVTAPAPPTVINAVAFAPMAPRGGCFAWFGFFVVAFAVYWMIRF